MAKATSFANDVLDAGYNGASSGTATIGGTSYAYPFRMKFLTTTSTADTAGTEWATSGGYTAGGVSLAGAFGTAASAASKSNTAAITVTNAPAGTWAGNEIVDSSATPKRLNFAAITGGSKTINAGDTCSIPVGSLTGTES